MQAIETIYKGYRFRSRLEARWAVFFDALGIKWEYEPEGYDLEEAGWYLPDFWLPQVKMFAEVKPGEFNEKERDKALALAFYSRFPVLKLIGTPEDKPYQAIEFSNGGLMEIDYCLTMYGEYPITEGRFYSMPGNYGKYGDAHWPDTEWAAEKARGARFEYGESGGC